MKGPTTVRGLVKTLEALCNTKVRDLKGADKLSEEESHNLVATIAGVQNEAGETLRELFLKHKCETEF